jgi:hypothetical protein
MREFVEFISEYLSGHRFPGAVLLVIVLWLTTVWIKSMEDSSVPERIVTATMLGGMACVSAGLLIIKPSA